MSGSERRESKRKQTEMIEQMYQNRLRKAWREKEQREREVANASAEATMKPLKPLPPPSSPPPTLHRPVALPHPSSPPPLRRPVGGKETWRYPSPPRSRPNSPTCRGCRASTSDPLREPMSGTCWLCGPPMSHEDLDRWREELIRRGREKKKETLLEEIGGLNIEGEKKTGTRKKVKFVPLTVKEVNAHKYPFF